MFMTPGGKEGRDRIGISMKDDRVVEATLIMTICTFFTLYKNRGMSLINYNVHIIYKINIMKINHPFSPSDQKERILNNFFRHHKGGIIYLVTILQPFICW